MNQFSKIIVSIIFTYSRVKCYLSDILSGWYQKSSMVRKIWNITEYFLQYSGYILQKYVYQNNCEPVSETWSHTFIIIDEDPKYLEYKEKYEVFTISEESPMIVSFPVIHPYLIFTTRNSLKMMKYTVEDGDCYYLSLISPDRNIVDITVIEPSLVSFLSIEYTHPCMDESIEIDIPKGMMVVGNQLLNMAFIYRALLYQSKDFIFNEEYVIKIMDDNIQLFEVKYSEYVEILSESYKVIREKTVSDSIQNIIDPTPIESKEWDHWEE
jgi:hypothetical protein